MGKLELIEEQHDTVNRLELRLQNAKAEYDSAKKLLDQAKKRRDMVIVLGEAALKEQAPLFKDDDEDQEGKGKKGKASKASTNGHAPAATKAPGTDKSWRKRPVKDAITLGSVVNGLEVWEPPVTILGDLIPWLKKHKFEDLKGVGADKAAKAADQLAEFQKAHPEYDWS